MKIFQKTGKYEIIYKMKNGNGWSGFYSDKEGNLLYPDDKIRSEEIASNPAYYPAEIRESPFWHDRVIQSS